MRLEENLPVIITYLSCIISISLMVVYVKYRKLVNTLDEIGKVFDYVSRGNLSERLHIRYNNELRKLSLNINKMITALQDRDIKIKDYQKELLRDIKKLKELDQIREDFSATLAHDLKIPILAEKNTLQFFLKGTFGEISQKQEEALLNMLESNKDLLNLVNTLLAVYKYDAIPSEPEKEPVDIKVLLTECLNEISSLAAKNNHSLENNIRSEIPLLNIDRNEIKRVVLNLLNNAITYTQPGGVISLDHEVNETDVIIKIKDNGKGISETDISKIFDRYFSKAMKFRKVGTGLGLYLSKQIIENHNGKIWAESLADKGSIFSFSIPLS
ncbi:MAG: HAMP domain-containing sensor histidine kinase [bacterium]